MDIFAMNDTNIPTVAGFIARIKPDWWDYEGAFGQLSGTQSTVGTVGWFMGGGEEHPKGWLLCRETKMLSCLEVECSGYDDNGVFALGHQLLPMFEEAERYARSKGLRIFKTAMGSAGLSCHGRPLGEYWQELRDLHSTGSYRFRLAARL